MKRPSRLASLFLLWGLAITPGAVAHSLHVRDEGHLHFVRSSGSQIIDEGPAKGDLPGSVRVHFTYTGAPTVTATFTILGHGWSISGRGTGRLSSPNTPTPSFRGKLTITGGTGRYRGASGNGELFGVYYRRTYALTVQTIGTLHY